MRTKICDLRITTTCRVFRDAICLLFLFIAFSSCAVQDKVKAKETTTTMIRIGLTLRADQPTRVDREYLDSLVAREPGISTSLDAWGHRLLVETELNADRTWSYTITSLGRDGISDEQSDSFENGWDRDAVLHVSQTTEKWIQVW